ncbi:MAG: DNA polymerase I [Acidimicrobiia bacterium]
MAKLLVLDGNSLTYRAFFALPETLTTPDGQPTNAVYGFTNMLVRMLRERRPDYVAVAFDTRTPAFRKDAYPGYKAQREETPAPLRSQMDLVREVLEVLGVTILTHDDAEADDILATLARKATEGGVDVELVTGDRDIFQCVRDPQVKVIYTRRGISEVDEMDEAAVHARYGVTPAQYVELAALRGDNSDNLPGVPGIGDKTAAKLLDKYGGLDAIIDHVAELTPKQSENVAAHWPQVVLNLELMRLHDDVDVGVEIADLEVAPWDVDVIRRLFTSLAFNEIFNRVVELDRYMPAGSIPADVATAAPELDVMVVGDRDELAGALAAFDGAVGIAAAVSTGGPGLPRGDAWAVAGEDGRCVVFGADVFDADAVGPLVVGDGPRFRAHDAKPIIEALIDEGIDAAALELDTEIAAFLLDPATGSHPIEDLARRYLGFEISGTAAVAAPGTQGELALGVDADAELARDEDLARRAWAAAVLAPKLRTQLDNVGCTGVYDDLERPLTRILARMEAAGIRVDVDYLAELSGSLTGRIAELERTIWDHAGHEFQVNSTKQLQEVLFDELGLPPQKKTKTGFSTDAATLEVLAVEHPIAEALLEYRNLEKLRSTYTDALPPLVDPADGRIHTRFKQTGAATGRLSSENPNLMNIPIRTEEGNRIRRAFVPADGCLLASCDYSQIELRIMAHLSGDPGLIDAFHAGDDIHRETAARVWGVETADVSGEQRRRAKVINYGLLYGMQTWGLASRMGIERDEAQSVIDAYFTQFSTLRAYMDEIVATATEAGYTETLFGRRRLFPELRSRNPRIRQMAERQALNAPIQGTAADIMKLAMVHVDAILPPDGSRGRMLLQVHDELVVEGPAGEMEVTAAEIGAVMEDVVDLKVPLVVDVHTGASWAEAK